MTVPCRARNESAFANGIEPPVPNRTDDAAENNRRGTAAVREGSAEYRVAHANLVNIRAAMARPYERRVVVFYDVLGWRSHIGRAGHKASDVSRLRRLILKTTLAARVEKSLGLRVFPT